MGSVPPELSLDFVRPSSTTKTFTSAIKTFTFLPETITDFLKEVSMIGDASVKGLKVDSFLNDLEEEKTKIDAFKRELPLCMLLLNDAIQVVREELMQCGTSNNQQPVLEEFIPLKKKIDDHGDDRESDGLIKEKDSIDKKNWMSSVQLWITDDHHPSTDYLFDAKQSFKLESKTNKKANQYVNEDAFQACKGRTAARTFMPFKAYPGSSRKEDDSNREELPVPALSLLTPGIKSMKEESNSTGSRSGCSRSVSTTAPNSESNLRNGPQSQQQSSRKHRRCWSPELHRQFVNALQQLGGAQVATPKQIRELMQVDGLTNDEVKSHLQKYRLHTRRVPPATASAPANQSAIVLGGLWMAQDQYGDSSKANSSKSGSPQGPLQLAVNTGGTSTTGGDSMEDDEDAKSEGYSWKSHIHRSGKDV
ncbi:hypothetical protein Peur_052465 [Populus x canadensis]|uniref:HTH myb-type domain-containing protein n=1 Tax=Populus deltoides TaxID=3696 RepID=A0A8T2Z0M7_POPDE|nr:hypothetical protein H0E87_008373 [Populus deltoides]